jgi:hypothetical protein
MVGTLEAPAGALVEAHGDDGTPCGLVELNELGHVTASLADTVVAFTVRQTR